MNWLFIIIPLIMFNCDQNGNDSDSSFYIKNINISSEGISASSNIYIQFSSSINEDNFTLLNNTVLDADGDEVELDFSSALKHFEQQTSYITINGDAPNFWYDKSTNTIAIITTTIEYNQDQENEILNENDDILIIKNKISDEEGNSLDENMKYTITKDTNINVSIVPNPGSHANFFSGGEGDKLSFYMTGVPENYVINIFDMNNDLISTQDNNHIHAELSSFAVWTPEIDIIPGIYKFELFHNNNLEMQSVIVISH